MKVYTISRRGDGESTMKFLYLNDKLSERSWLTRVNMGFYKLNYFLKVESDIIIGENSYSPMCGDIIFYRPFEEHYGRLRFPQTAEYYEFLIPPDFFRFADGGDELLSFIDSGKTPPCVTLSAERRNLLATRFAGLNDMARAGAKDIYLLSEIVQILRVINEGLADADTAGSGQLLSPNLTTVLRYISDNYTQLSTLADIAEGVHFSQSYVCRMFREELGCGPYRYLSDKKLAYAMSLLHGGANVTEACYQSGFNDCSVFIQAFKRKFGATPYRCKKVRP